MTSYIKHSDTEAPKNRLIIIRGHLYGSEFERKRELYPTGLITCVGYFDQIDDSYAITSHPYYGPFIKPIEWCELPE